MASFLTRFILGPSQVVGNAAAELHYRVQGYVLIWLSRRNSK